MLFKIITTLFVYLLPLEVSPSETWIKAGYYWSSNAPLLPIHEVDSTLFTHLICAFAEISFSTYKVYITPADEPHFSNFTDTVKHKNPYITTLVSIWAGGPNSSDFYAMVSQASRRNSFIESSIRTARRYGFQGIDLAGISLGMGTGITNMGTLLDEWRAAIDSETRNSKRSPLILSMAGYRWPTLNFFAYPVNSMKRNLDWLTIAAYDYHSPESENFTRAHAALYDPLSNLNTDHAMKQWIAEGFPASKMVLGLAHHGYAWFLVNPKDNSIGSPASGPALAPRGQLTYKSIKDFARGYEVAPVYNSTYVVNYYVFGSSWIGFDDVEAIRTKVSYAKDKGLIGYNAWEVSSDDNWVLSKAAFDENKKQGRKRLLLAIVLPVIAVLTLLLATLMWYLRRRVLRRKVTRMSTIAQNSESPSLQVFSFSDIKTFTNNFSSNNKLGEGRYGPVHKGKLLDGQEIAVKRLSKTSKQGAEEFKNEVTLTAKLQHVNLVRLLGFCTERDEKLLIYEYMPNKSLDFYLYDPVRRQSLGWSKWVQIIEGVIQGLLYLQEYSRLTIIHRDLKASNILLDNEMKPKIADFGLAKIFQKDECEASTSRIVGTYGYVPPEYVRDGIYSTKYDVYSFGVLLLQIISGKRITHLCGLDQNLTLLQHAYELWRDGKSLEFTDSLLDDASSSCKIIRCMQVALLCVQEKSQDRPSMLEISSMLKNEIDAIPTPKKPAFSTNRDKEVKSGSKKQEEIFLDNFITNSLLEGR